MRSMKLTLLTLAVSLWMVFPALAQVGDDFEPVPEPGSIALLLTGVGIGVAVFLRRRK